MAVHREWVPPQQFDEYRLVQPLGHGGMGHVFLAHDTLLDRMVAVKFISAVEPGTESRERFLIEARAAARLQHPNVAAVYRVGELDRRPYIISEFIRGTTLDKLDLPVPWKRALDLGILLARGLAAAHRHGVLHRDIKPSNAILGEDGIVKLVDFGLAKLTDDFVPNSASPPPMSHVQKPLRAATGIGTLMSRENEAETRKFVASASIFEVDASPDLTLQSATGADSTPQPEERRSDQTLPSISDGSPAVARASKPSAAEVVIESLTRVGDVMGTPYYMAPEVWRGEQGTRRSDVYALGVVLYELCAGFAPHREVRVKELRRVRSEEDAPPLAEVAAQVDSRFAAVVDRCLRRDPAERFASGDELLDALEQLVPSASGAAIPEGNPYRGLHSFEAEHRALFFGRSGEVRSLLERLRSESFVLVAGDSGTGKSSLCRAGVLPLVEDGGLQEARTWTVVRLVPGRRPLGGIAAALAPLLNRDDDEALLRELTNEPESVCRDLRKRLGASGGLVIFVDQLEELLTLSPWEEATATASFFGRLAVGVPGVRLLATVRGDFLTRLARLPGLANDLTRALYLLRPLSPDRIREAIVGPAHATGVRFESEALVETLVESTARAEGALPLLQFALAELWEARDKAKQSIPSSALDAIGGVAGALARHADGVLASLLPGERTAARRILMRLVTVQGARARRTEEELVVGDPAARAALDALVRGRLLAAREVEGGTSYEVAHETLLHGWTTLREWLDAQAESRAVRQRLETAAVEWDRLGRTREALWSGRQLAEATFVRREELGPREAEFLRVSRSAVRLGKIVRTVLIVAIPILLSLLYVGVELKARRELDRKIAVHLAEAKTTVAAARIKNDETVKLRTDAFARFDARQQSEGETAWVQALALAEETERTYAKAGQALESALVLDSSRKTVRDLLGDLLYERALLADRDSRPAQRDELLQRLALYDEAGERRSRWDALATLALKMNPPASQVLLQQYVNDDGRLHLENVRDLGTGPVASTQLPPGSYLVVVTAPERVEVRYPVQLKRGESLEIDITLPKAADIPKGFAFIPGGRFLVGTAANEHLRRFLSTVPLHEARTGPYLIAKNETTYADWINYLSALPPLERFKRPLKIGSLRGSIELKELPMRQWELTIQPTSQVYKAKSGEKIQYRSRSRRVSQDWLQFPISGISAEEAEAYMAWLQSAGGVPGARLCTEHEWEMAARGADGREYPHGDRLDPDDANFDATYGKDPLGFGLDEVGSHPATRSPFGLDDITGNAWEWTRSTLSADEYAIRGGGYYFDATSARATNRYLSEPTLRDITVGVRACATFTPR